MVSAPNFLITCVFSEMGLPIFAQEACLVIANIKTFLSFCVRLLAFTHKVTSVPSLSAFSIPIIGLIREDSPSFVFFLRRKRRPDLLQFSPLSPLAKTDPQNLLLLVYIEGLEC